MTGQEKFRKKLPRQSFPKFMAEQPPAVVVMEACGSAHYWALLEQIAEQTVRINARTGKIKVLAAEADTARRLQMIPGVGLAH